MPSTLSLECSKKVYELLGNTYKTEVTGNEGCSCQEDGYESCAPDIPLPDFSELIRLLPKIAEKKGWPWLSNTEGKLTLGKVAEDCLWLYMPDASEDEGMERVSEYLEKIL